MELAQTLPPQTKAPWPLSNVLCVCQCLACVLLLRMWPLEETDVRQYDMKQSHTLWITFSDHTSSADNSQHTLCQFAQKLPALIHMSSKQAVLCPVLEVHPCLVVFFPIWLRGIA